MSIRNKLLALLIAGFGVLVSIFYVSSNTLTAASDQFTSDSLAQTYSAAWLSASDSQFQRTVERFDPELGAPEITRLWDPLDNAYNDDGADNPLVLALGLEAMLSPYMHTAHAMGRGEVGLGVQLWRREVRVRVSARRLWGCSHLHPRAV